MTPLAAKSTSGLRLDARQPAFGRADWIRLGTVVSLYAVLLAILVPRHEPWFDEAQAWLIARDDSPTNLFVHTLRYEGTPGLWHLLLMVPAKLGWPYAAMNWLAAALALAGVFVFLRWAPFPWPVKALFPFTFYVLYQYAVVARNYSLMPPLLFGLAALYLRKTERIYSYTALLCLLANVSLHGALIAGALMLLHLWDLRSQWPDLPRPVRVRQAKAAAAFTLAGLLIVGQLLPPADFGGFAGRQTSSPLWDGLARAWTVQVDALTGTWPLAAAVLAVSLWWFHRRQVLRVFLLPAGLVTLLFAVLYYTPTHVGILFLVWVFALWVSFSRLATLRRSVDVRNAAKRGEETSPLLPILAMLAVFAVQIYWSVSTAVLDYVGSYSGSRELAEYIKKEHLEDRVIHAVGYQTFAVQPYFDRNLFNNYNDKQGPAYWLWSSRHPPLADPREIWRGQPDLIIIGLGIVKREQVPDRPGYTRVGVFEGRLFYKGSDFDEHDSFLVLRKNAE